MIGQVVVKLNRACNLRCTYCYYINDNTKQPGSRMRWEVLNTFLDKYTNYCRLNSITGHVVFHGGEPLLMGPDYMRRALKHEGFAQGLLRASMQTNGILLDDGWLDLFQEHNMRFGVSLDGPAHIHDIHRVTRKGNGSYDATVQSIRRMQKRGMDVGVLAVVNPSADGQEVFQHFVDIGIKSMDFLLPTSNHALQAVEPLDMEGITRYIVKAFFAWYSQDDPGIRVRLFRSLMMRYFQSSHGYVPIGLAQWDALVVLETDGTIGLHEELADVDRFDGGQRYLTRYNILDCLIEDVADFTTRFWNDLGASALPTICRNCSVNNLCRGGSAATRYDATGSFDNPGVHCGTLFTLGTIIQRIMIRQGIEPNYPAQVDEFVGV